MSGGGRGALQVTRSKVPDDLAVALHARWRAGESATALAAEAGVDRTNLYKRFRRIQPSADPVPAPSPEAILVADVYGLCRRCGQAPRRGIRPLCRRCYDWAWRHGRLGDYPALTDPWVPSHEVMTARHRGRLEDFEFLTAELRVPLAEACRRIGVTTRTGLRYKAILRERAPESAAA